MDGMAAELLVCVRRLVVHRVWKKRMADIRCWEKRRTRKLAREVWDYREMDRVLGEKLVFWGGRERTESRGGGTRVEERTGEVLNREQKLTVSRS